MEIIPIKTRIVSPPQDDIMDLFEGSFPDLKNGDILLIASKIAAIHQGRCKAICEVEDEMHLIREQADRILSTISYQGKTLPLTIKNRTITPSAGIDKSNANGYYILWPESPERFAREICRRMKARFGLKDLGVIVTDSSPLPMRKGTVGISIGFYGIEPYKRYSGKKDIFGRQLEMTRSNVVDALAAIGVLSMGEGDEQTPLVIIRGAAGVQFTTQERYEEMFIDPREDIYAPIITDKETI